MNDPGFEKQAVLVGRDEQLAILEKALLTAQSGSSQVLALRGEAGMGKTALLDHSASRAVELGFRVLAVAGIESEMELPFASLHQFCAPILDQLHRIPGPQRDAMSVAFGLKDGESPNKFLVGMAVLSLLAGAAENPDRSLLCLVDDAHWLDEGSMQVLGFVARRLVAEPVAFVFALRDSHSGGELARLPQLLVEGLSDRDAHVLLSSAMPSPLDPLVQDRIVAEAHGNPMALLHLPRTLAPEELAGGFWLPGSHHPESYIENAFYKRFMSLRDDSRQLLLTAAAEPTGDVGLLWRAAHLQHIPMDANATADVGGLVEFGINVRFQHPLARSTIYRRTSVADRRTVHRALAEATDPTLDPDRRAWHRAHAATQPDESVAADLERSASRARDRGGAAAAASFLRRSAELTPDPAQRVTRALAAAQVGIDAGGGDAPFEMLALAEHGPLDALQRARIERLRAQLVPRVRGSSSARLLLDAARRLSPLDPAMARDTLLEALSETIVSGRLNDGAVEREIAEASRAVPLPDQPRTVDAVLDGIASQILDDYAAGAAALRRALETVRRDQSPTTPIDRNALRLAGPVAPEPLAAELWDDDAWQELAANGVRIARQSGALAVLPLALNYEACFHVHAGDFKAAEALVEEASALCEATGSPPVEHASLVLAAWRGRESEARALIASRLTGAKSRGEGRAVALAEYTNAVLYNGLGRYDSALSAATDACSYEDLGIYGWGLVELIEAATHSGDRDAAAAALDKLTERTRISGTEWAQGAEAFSRAMLSDDEETDQLYQKAIKHLGECRVVVHLARARLLYGEWLRRHMRRKESRNELLSAYQTFSKIGAEGFAERAHRELLATGETARKRTVATTTDFTSQETQIAKLAQSGYTNREIADYLFISPRTVEWHLSNIFAKLGVSSRRQLRSALSPSEPRLAERQHLSGRRPSR
ncbi:AAA family ATPase [Streptomyces sp. NPDC048643]|uniref:AAA family ATPase n=1 Tax=Streptomyces sp. NPDC048643 TaxID=3155637 RepID=UPI00343BE3C4